MARRPAQQVYYTIYCEHLHNARVCTNARSPHGWRVFYIYGYNKVARETRATEKYNITAAAAVALCSIFFDYIIRAVLVVVHNMFSVCSTFYD